MIKIRQEIPIQNLYTGGYTFHRVQLDPKEWEPTGVMFLELNTENTADLGVFNSGDLLAAFDPPTATGFQTVRTTGFMFTGSTLLARNVVNLHVSGNSTSGRGFGKIIMIQSGEAIHATTTFVDLSYPVVSNAQSYTSDQNKIWRFEPDNFQCHTSRTRFNAWYSMSSGGSGSIDLQTGDGVNWNNFIILGGNLTSQFPAFLQTTIDPISGRHYRMIYKTSRSDQYITIYNCYLKVRQIEGANLSPGTSYLSRNIQGGTAGSSESSQATSQEVMVTNTGTALTGIELYLKKVGSPTDSLFVEIAATTGSAAFVSGSITGTALTTSFERYKIPLDNLHLSGYVKYYFRILRFPQDRDTSNYYQVAYIDFSEFAPSGLRMFGKSNNVWSSNDPIEGDIIYKLLGIRGITRTESKYTTANTIKAATGVWDNELVKWFTNDWEGINNSYYAEHTSTSTTAVSDMQNKSGAFVTLPGSEITGLNRVRNTHQITMPSTGIDIRGRITTI